MDGDQLFLFDIQIAKVKNYIPFGVDIAVLKEKRAVLCGERDIYGTTLGIQYRQHQKKGKDIIFMGENFNVDNVNHPKHYQSSSGLETIDVIESFTENLKGAEATNTGNVLKYMCRWKEKNGLEDLKKAEWYLKRLIDYVEKRRK